MLPHLLEQVADTRCTNTDEHLDELRPRNGEEWHAGLACNGLGQQRLTSTCSARG